MNILLPIEISFVAGIIFLILPKKLEKFTIVSSLILGLLNFVLSIILFFNHRVPYYVEEYILLDQLSLFIFLCVGFFGFIISWYSVGYIKNEEWRNSKFKIQNINAYFGYVFLTLCASFLIAISNNLILLLCSWGFLGLTLYLLIQMGIDGANDAAKKTLIIIGASDCFLIIGIAIIWYLENTFKMTETYIITNSPLPAFAFICFALAGFAKAGNMPLHTWIPPCAKSAPIAITAFLPAAVDKLLGIYLLGRCAITLFSISPGLQIVVMVFGALTVLLAVYMAMVQHSGRLLLSYHAISQVGYMVLGVGTNNPIGICGGLFHMINHAIYKSCLFLGLGDVEQSVGTDELDKLGGLSKLKRLTLFSMLTSALAISGIPPLNGFFSKWLVYQGVIQTFGERNAFVPSLCLIAAGFGSALTLASFMKLIHTIFLSSPTELIIKDELKIKGSPFLIILPQIILSLACIGLGIFANRVIISPVFSKFLSFEIKGLWQPGLSTLLIILGIILGLIIYGVSRINVRLTDEFIGGERITPYMRVSGDEFYLTIEKLPIFNKMYEFARKQFFDIYAIMRNWFINVGKIFSFVHTGALPLYLIWIVIGFIIILLLR